MKIFCKPKYKRSTAKAAEVFVEVQRLNMDGSETRRVGEDCGGCLSHSGVTALMLPLSVQVAGNSAPAQFSSVHP